MRSVTLGNTSIHASVLGFGCVKLTTHPTRADAVKMLEHVFNSGITHFDVARLYGFGQAEGILGEFLAGKRDRVTVTTKFGIRPSQAVAKHRKLIGLARRVLRYIPAIEKRAKRRIGSMIQSGNYTADEARTSCEISLREMRTDTIDIFELHEATARDANNPELIGALDDLVRAGKIRAYGVGSLIDKIGLDLAKFNPRYSIFQFGSTALDCSMRKMQNTAGKGLITFGVMSPLARIMESAPPEFCDRKRVIGLLFAKAVRDNPNGVSLFASMTPANVDENIRTATGNRFREDELAAFETFLNTIPRE